MLFGIPYDHKKVTSYKSQTKNSVISSPISKRRSQKNNSYNTMPSPIHFRYSYPSPSYNIV